MNRKINIFLFLVIFSFWGCQNENIVNEQLFDFTSDFDSVWVNYDKTYPLFTYKNIDWYSIKTEHRDKFKNITEHQRNDYLASALSVLKDGHIFINASSNNPIPTYINDSYVRNFNEDYLNIFKSSMDWKDINSSWGWGKIENVGYIRIKSLNPNHIDSLGFDLVLDSLKNTDGLIIDLRYNSGGTLPVCSIIWDRFTDKSIKVGYQLYRNGPNHDDFAPEISVVASPRGEWHYSNKVVLLIGRFCVSSGEILAEGFSHFENAILIGDTTAGIVTAPITKHLPDGLEYSLPVVAYYNVEGIPIEWNGVSPDIYTNPDELTDDTDKDVLINQAIELIK